tara:strand:- start:372 stop:1508 length:1137 start_codon:yes stop_codon:yes gene_type:complete
MYKHLDLFSGIGGFSLGLEATGEFETVAFCDYSKFPQKVLRKHWPLVPIYEDVKELNSERLKSNGINKIDIITGGYPCQPFSVAGKQKGEQDPRHVWPEMFRLIKELRPTWVIGENVAGHIKLGLDTVLENLESEGYSTRTFSISAASIGANHKRERVWIIANKNVEDSRSCDGWIQSTGDQESIRSGTFEEEFWPPNTDTTARPSEGTETMADSTAHRSFNEQERNSRSLEDESQEKERGRDQSTVRIETRSSDVADTESISSHERKFKFNTEKSKEKRFSRSKIRGESGNVANTESSYRDEHEIDREHGKTETQEVFGNRDGISRGSAWWEVEPDVGRVADGLPDTMDRLKSLGNSLVPQIPYYIALSILEAERNG